MIHQPSFVKLFAALEKLHVQARMKGDVLQLQFDEQLLRCQLIRDQGKDSSLADLFFPFDKAITERDKFEALLLSKLKLNKVVYARQCEIKKITKPQASEFLSRYHLLGATTSASQFALFYKDEILSVATFSAGRKMNRLPANKRSFELIRFCTKAGYTVAGGLTKLLQHFIREKQPGDIMTYVDRQLSDGSSYLKAGFKKVGETEARSFCISEKSCERKPVGADEDCNYIFTDEGNLKLVLLVDSGMKK